LDGWLAGSRRRKKVERTIKIEKKKKSDSGIMESVNFSNMQG
jgi:hypothetical protein